jgi:AraC family transcriptional regulator
MDWLSQLNDALRYIEDHLDGEIELEQVAKLACCSSFHFQRMFSYMANVSLAEYVRRRRMTKAAFDLQNTTDKVVDVALRYGYDSPTAFNRAFQSIHGVAPSAARQEGTYLKAYHPISFKITIRGEAEMNYRIEKKGAFRIVGVKLECPWTPEKQEGFTQVPKFWAEHGQKGTIPQLCARMNQEPMGVLGVSVGDWQTAGSFDYYIAVSSTQSVPEGMSTYEVPAATWAIFECRGPMPHAIQDMQKRIMTEWFPNSGYQYADAPDIEQYTEGDQSSKDYLCYIWVPVQK